MAVVTREFSAEEVEELDLPYSTVSDSIIGRSRWGIYYESVFETNGEFWRFSWEDGATENQDYNSFEDRDGIVAVQVERKSVEVVDWVAVDV